MNGSKKNVREASFKTFYARAANTKIPGGKGGVEFFHLRTQRDLSPFFFSRYTHALTDYKKLPVFGGSYSLFRGLVQTQRQREEVCHATARLNNEANWFTAQEQGVENLLQKSFLCFTHNQLSSGRKGEGANFSPPNRRI